MQLYGRDAVLRACTSALDAAVAGRGRVLLLTGEAGIGKTTVAQVLAEAAAARGAAVRWGACWDGVGDPYAPWIDLLRRPGGDGCADVAERLAEAADAGSDPAAVDHARRRIHAAVCDAVSDAGQARPQLLVLEDLHWADAGSLLLLRALAARVASMPVVLAGTCRDDELPADHPLWNLASTEQVGLGGLGTGDVHRLLTAVLGREPAPAEADAVAARCGGNPLFVAHVGRLIAAGAPLGVPAGVRALLARRLARLPSACDEALGAAAVLGTEFAPAAVAAMLGRAEGDVLDALDGAAAARIAQPDPGRPDRWAFTHALLQEARYDRLGSAQRAELHRRACEVLAARGRSSARLLAEHAFRGRFEPDDTRPAGFALAAADEARGRLAVEDAAVLYGEVLARAPAGRAGDEQRALAWLGLGDTRLRSGDGAGAADAFEAAADHADRTGDADLLARAALGFGAGLGGFEIRMFDERQVQMLEAAVAALPPGSPLRPWALARLSVALSFVGSDARRLTLAEEAVALARRAGDPAATGAALASRCDALAGPAHAAERLAVSGEIVSIGTALGDRRLELLGRRLRVAALAELCDLDGLDHEVAAFERGAAALGDPLYAWYGPLWRGMRALGAGRIADAARLRDEARAVGAAAGSGNARVLSLVLDLFIAVETGVGAQIRARHAELGAEFPELVAENGNPMLACLGVVLRLPGWADRARDVLARVDRLRQDAEWLCTVAPLTDLLDALAGTGQAAGPEVAEAARDLYRRFAPYAGHGVVEGIAAVHRGPTDTWLMTLAALAGDGATALDHLGRALDLAVRNGPLVLANTRLRAAGVLDRLGGPHATRAAELRAAAAAAYAALGLPVPPLPVRGPDRLPVAPAPTVQGPTVQGPTVQGPALVREGDAWAVTWEGRTVRVRHAKGVADLAVLLTRAGREVHVRELEGLAAVPGGGAPDAALDPAAVAAYRKRLREIEEDLDEADRHGDQGRAARLTAERDALVAELSSAFGLGGRPRAAGPDPDERLRKAVSGRVKAAIDRLEQLHPALGRHLRVSVRTGLWCAYDPERPVDWQVGRG